MVLNIFIEAGVQNCSDVNKWRIGQKKFELTILAYGEKTSKGKSNWITFYIQTINIQKGPAIKIIKLSGYWKVEKQFETNILLFIWIASLKGQFVIQEKLTKYYKQIYSHNNIELFYTSHGFDLLFHWTTVWFIFFLLQGISVH